MGPEKIHTEDTEEQGGSDGSLQASDTPGRRGLGSVEMTPGQKLRMRKMGHKEYAARIAAEARGEAVPKYSPLGQESDEKEALRSEWFQKLLTPETRMRIDTLREELNRHAENSDNEKREWTDEELYRMLQEREAE